MIPNQLDDETTMAVVTGEDGIVGPGGVTITKDDDGVIRGE